MSCSSCAFNPLLSLNKGSDTIPPVILLFQFFQKDFNVLKKNIGGGGYELGLRYLQSGIFWYQWKRGRMGSEKVNSAVHC